MGENQSNLSIDMTANQNLILRWEPIRRQHWDEKSSELSIEMRANKRSVLRWKELRVQYEGWEVLIENQSKLSIMMRSVAKPRWIFTLLLVFATISRHCPGSRHKTWDQRQDSSISVLLSSFSFQLLTHSFAKVEKMRQIHSFALLPFKEWFSHAHPFLFVTIK